MDFLSLNGKKTKKQKHKGTYRNVSLPPSLKELSGINLTAARQVEHKAGSTFALIWFWTFALEGESIAVGFPASPGSGNIYTIH